MIGEVLFYKSCGVSYLQIEVLKMTISSPVQDAIAELRETFGHLRNFGYLESAESREYKWVFVLSSCSSAYTFDTAMGEIEKVFVKVQ